MCIGPLLLQIFIARRLVPCFKGLRVIPVYRKKGEDGGSRRGRGGGLGLASKQVGCNRDWIWGPGVGGGGVNCVRNLS